MHLDAGSLGGDMTICDGENPPALPIAVPATSSSGTLAYQWQSSTTSCAAGWSDIAGATSQNYNPPAISTTTYYRLVVSATECNGLGGCEEVTSCLTVTVFPVPTATASGVNVSCYDEGDGSANAVVSGGTAPYSFGWNDPAMQTTATASGLTGGTFQVTVTDVNGCEVVQTVTITQPADPLCEPITIIRN